MLCKNCGTELPDGTKFCTNCRTKQEIASGGKKRNAPFIIVIVLLSLTTLGSGITAFVFYQKADYLISVGETFWYNVWELHDLIEAVEKGDYSGSIYTVNREEWQGWDGLEGWDKWKVWLENGYFGRPIYKFSIVPWKHPADRAAVITRTYYYDKNSYWNYTDPLQADKIAYLQFDFRLTGNIWIGESLSIKIIRASTGEDKCENRHTVTVTKKKEYSTGWGNASGGTYERGWYLIQIVRHNEKAKDLVSKQEVIGQQYVYIQ